MILRLAAKLAKKIGTSTGRQLPLDANPFADWTARLFTVQRTQYIMISNTASLYSMIMYGKGITNDGFFLNRTTSLIREFLEDDGHQFIFQRLVAPSTATISFSTALNRNVTGSINDLVLQAKFILAEGEVSPFDASFIVNDTPLSYLDYANPKKAFSQIRIQTKVSNNEMP